MIRPKSCVAVLTCAIAATAPADAQQDILYYQFDIGSGPNVFNAVHTSGRAPVLGTIETSLPGGIGAAWSPGRSGTALTGGDNTSGASVYARVDTGFMGGIRGSFSYAFWLKERNDPTTRLSYFISNLGSFRAFTNGVANQGIWTRNWGGADLQLTVDVQSLARTAWTHIALTVDGAGGQAIYYVDGQPQTPITISNAADIPTSTASMYVGMHSSTSTPSTYDLDEFYFTERVLSAAEVQVLFTSQGPLAYTGTYGLGGCTGGADLSASGGRPVLGNASYRFDLTAPAGESFTVGVGTNRDRLGGFRLPLDLGTVLPQLRGCFWEADQDLAVGGGVVPPSGVVTIPLGIPNSTSLLGFSVWSQAITLDTTTVTFRVTPAIQSMMGN